MKKVLSILLVAVLVLTFAIPAFAANVPSDNITGEASKDVTASYAANQAISDATVYSVNISWVVGGNLTYSAGTTTYTWNADATKYENGTISGAGWSGTASVAITVTNKSNAQITAKAEWSAVEGITSSCTFTQTNGEITVGSAAATTNLAEGDLTGEQVDGTINATVGVTGGSITQNNQKVGTITVTITAQ